MYIYSFWEPRRRIPYYLRLCMETWKKFLPNAEIVILDYKNLSDFIDVKSELGEKLFSSSLKLALIADAIRVAVLAKHGGIWLDLDTIILKPEAEKYFFPDEKNRTIFFGSPQGKFVHLAFINTPSGSKCMTTWLEFLKEKIESLNPENKLSSAYQFANVLIDRYAKKFPNELNILERQLIMPELDSIPNPYSAPHMQRKEAYVDYYFIQSHHAKDINNDLLLLHNSWTPREFRDFSPETFLRCNCTMTNILAEVLEMKLPPQSERVPLDEILKK